MKIKELESRFLENPGASQEDQVIRNTCLRVAIDFNNFLPESDEKLEVMNHLEALKDLAIAALEPKEKNAAQEIHNS
jgi:hypothetical protein